MKTKPSVTPPVAKTAPAQKPPRTSTGSAAASIDSDLSPGEQRFLEAMAFWASVGVEIPSNNAVAAIIGIKPRGGSFSGPRAKLKAAGLIEYFGGGNGLTRSGRAACTPYSFDVQTVAELHARVLNRFDGREALMLQACLDAYPDPVSNDDLAQAAGIPSTRGGNFSAPRAKLRKADLLTGETGMNRAADWLFPASLV